MIRFTLLFAGAHGAFLVGGCDDTSSGVSKDAAEKSAKGKEIGRDSGAAMSLTPNIKAAIISNPMLNDNGNQIDVDTTTESVTLTGFAKSAANKDLAGQLAKKVMDENKSSLPLLNQLKVVP